MEINIRWRLSLWIPLAATAVEVVEFRHGFLGASGGSCGPFGVSVGTNSKAWDDDVKFPNLGKEFPNPAI